MRLNGLGLVWELGTVGINNEIRILMNIIMKKEIHWLERPTKKSLLIIGLLLTFGTTLAVLSMTDLFRESMLQGKNTFMILWMVGGIVSYYRYILRYKKLKL